MEEVNALIDFLNLANKRGAFDLNEAGQVIMAIRTLQQKEQAGYEFILKEQKPPSQKKAAEAKPKKV